MYIGSMDPQVRYAASFMVAIGAFSFGMLLLARFLLLQLIPLTSLRLDRCPLHCVGRSERHLGHRTRECSWVRRSLTLLTQNCL